MPNVKATTPSAAEILESVMSAPSDADAFQVNNERPFEFRWAWTGRIGQSDYTYQRKELPNVIGQDKAKGTRAGRGGSASGPKGMAGLVFTCPLCSQDHSPINPCA